MKFGVRNMRRGATSIKTKVPKNIRNAIRSAAKYREKAKHYENIIEQWFDKNEVEEDDSFRNAYIDCVQQSYDPEEAIKIFETLLKEQEDYM